MNIKKTDKRIKMGKGENKKVRKKVKVDRVGRQTYSEVVAALAMTTKRRVERMSKDKDLVLVAHLRNVESVLHFLQHHLKETTVSLKPLIVFAT